jgi:hypothetical protein
LTVAAGSASLSPGARLVLLTAAVSPSDASLREALRSEIDWNELNALLRYERAASVLLRQLDRVGAGNRGGQELRQLATMSVMQMLRLEHLLHRTIDIFAQHGIETMLLKGAGLAYTAYPSFADRPMGDLDLLVRPRHARRAWALLQTHGWLLPNGVQTERFTGHHHLPPLFQESRTFRIEIHDALLPEEHPFRFSTESVWTSALKVTANDRQFTVPDPMHQLWHVCVHFVWSHGMTWGSWRTLRDCAALIERGRFDWSDFVSFAKETRAATCCFWTLRLARRFTGAAVPDHVLKSLRPPYPEYIVQRLERHIVSSLFPSEDRCPSVRLTQRLWEMAILPRWSGHGATRPWHVTERWNASAAPLASESSKRRAVMDSVRKIVAGGAYLLRLGRVSLPVNFA